MNEQYFDIARTELQEGAKDAGHPFHFFTLATTGINQVPRLRTVVLRKVSKDLTLTIFTDKRSRKVTHIKEHNKVCVLFYHPEKLLQLKIDGVAYMESDQKKLQKIWDSMDAPKKKDYLTAKEPGTKISHLEQIEYLDTSQHFSVMHIEPYKIEYLKLKRPNHIRVQYSLTDGNKWESSFLVP
ncbi:pyridoxamine 5'-phosphate oxidase family protein [Robertkochia flava]|uniref:pyridoxamine 5'-phosphate oxidase family protein n=1 Tax=Robertkochia flava TaxID=3447986 RepID=UPI001CCCB5A2|nr:pyridoxamine 5'-phosphate oxidase family protein [Robertkochia marina]